MEMLNKIRKTLAYNFDEVVLPGSNAIEFTFAQNGARQPVLEASFDMVPRLHMEVLDYSHFNRLSITLNSEDIDRLTVFDAEVTAETLNGLIEFVNNKLYEFYRR